MRVLLRNGGRRDDRDVEEALRCSAPTARAILETLDKLGIGDFENPGPPLPARLTLAEPLRWLLGGIEKKPTPSSSGIETNLTPSAGSDDLVEALCLICERLPVVGGPCSLRCAKCRERAAA